MGSAFQKWRFFRAGGFDQVRLDTAEELLSIGSLDQKLWLALSCPVKGIVFDPRTLTFLDSDADGQVRAPELLAAVQWAGERLADTSVLAAKLAGVPLEAIRQDDEEGLALYAAAKEALADAGATDTLITVDLASQAQSHYVERALKAWDEAGAQVQPLGEDTAAAYATLQAVTDKVDDWFVRCNLAAFDPRAGEALNASTDAFALLNPISLKNDSEGISALPLARVDATGNLPLGTGINPAWTARIAALQVQVVQPLLGERAVLSLADWNGVKASLQAYADWLASKPDPAAEGVGVRALEKLARYVRDLLVFANNFVAFRDFYTRQGSATFQLGTLYLDGRSAELCVAVNDAAKHTALASLARICLVYVDCVRGSEKMAVAAAFTAGDSDQLMVGRNGVFYDRKGQDWNATIVKMVEHPISLRQAFWSPYKRMARLINDQLQKFAAAKSKESDDRMAAVAQDASKKATSPVAGGKPQAAAQPFDVAKFAGIFAAIGLAVGALGTALAAALTGLFNLRWWQMPIALVGLVLLISAPAVIMAWFKLRTRNLGPILDANGWAINARARINIPFGTSLTQLAQLPANAERSMTDPYAEEKKPWLAYTVVLLALAAGAVLALWRLGVLAF
jgi:hypothetical protein